VIPTELGRCAALREIVLDDHAALSGSLPSTLGTLQALRKLRITDTSLHGPIPTHVGQLSQLTMLFLQYNRFLGGSIPTEIARVTSLQNLVLNYNALV
jgi:hypothetical protein